MTRFAAFINVADLMMMFRSIADVVQKTDLRGLLTLPRIRTGQRQLVTAEASPAFKDYQKHLARRIEAIEARTGRVQKGDDILLVGHHRRAACRDRHAAGLARQRRRTGEQAQQADRQCASHLGRDGGPDLPPARRHAAIRSRARDR